MGVFGVGMFQDDVAADVRSQYLDLLASRASDAEAFRTIAREWNPSLADYDDEGPVFWLALAATQWEYGRLHPRAKAQAVKIFDQGTEAGRPISQVYVARLFCYADHLLESGAACRINRTRSSM
jgi:hypothetical protein